MRSHRVLSSILCIHLCVAFHGVLFAADVILYEHEVGKPGRTLSLNAGERNADVKSFNDMCTGVRIKKNGIVVILFEHPNMEGTGVVFERKGDFNIGGQFNDTMTAVQTLTVNRESVIDILQNRKDLMPKDRRFAVRYTRPAELVAESIAQRIGVGNKAKGWWEELIFELKDPKKPRLRGKYIIHHKHRESGITVYEQKMHLEFIHDLRTNTPIKNTFGFSYRGNTYRVDIPTFRTLFREVGLMR